MAVVRVWAFILCTGRRWHKTKEEKLWNNSKQIFPEQKTKKVFCFSLSVSSTRRGSTVIWNPLISEQIVDSFGQGKCTSVSLGIEKLCLWHPCLNKLVHVENWETYHLHHDLYVDISYQFSLAWVFVSHPCTQLTMNTLIHDLVLFTGIIQC